MKKFYRMIVLTLIFCLCFSAVTFASGGGLASAAEDHAKAFRCRNMPFAPDQEFPLVTLDDVAWNYGQYSGAPSGMEIPSGMPHFDTPKEIPLLVLVLEFTNIDYQDDYDWADHIFKGSHSLAQYYQDMSFNQFSFVPAKETSEYKVSGNHNTRDKVNDGIVHLTLDSKHGAWAGDDYYEMKAYVRCLVKAIDMADQYVDFYSVDANGEGELTTDEFALAVVVAGYEGAYDQNCTEGKNYYLWSFAWNISSGWYWYFRFDYPNSEDFLPRPDGVGVDSYITIPEQLEPGRMEPISVLAHELGHYLGLPDLYTTDYDYSALWGAYDVGFLSVMCSGPWGYSEELDDYCPVAFDAWSRSVLGWVKPVTVTGETSGTFNVASDNGGYNVLKVETGVSGDYYLLEAREYTGWDAGLDIDSKSGQFSGYCYADYADNGGLICWHIDDDVYEEYAASNEVNNTYHRPAVMPLYPELDKYGNVTFIGNIDKANSTAQPFFTYDIWQDVYAGHMDCIDFPTYNGSDKFSDRTYSGVRMNILPPAGDHSVRVSFGDTGKKILRLAGDDRYDTAIEAADQLKLLNGAEKFDRIIVASGADFPDALSASYLAVKKNAPIVLVGKDSASIKKVTSYVNSNLAKNGTVYIVGGTAAVTEDVEKAIKGTVVRLAGQDRFLTNIAVLKEAGVNGEELLVASGLNYADALSASASGRPILLVGKALTDKQKQYLADNKSKLSDKAFIIGGSAAVTKTVESQVKEYASTVKRLAGDDRFGTSNAVAKAFFKGDVSNLVIASGMTFPDGLSGGPVAIAYDAPLILVANKNYDHAAQFFAAKDADTLIVMGGTGAVPREIAETVAAPAKETA
ncbi:MAG: cell wall-binding repeat-containing protein [Firmicutes bacterium]|nr:cell wall-binding repeat-containing protein [Bacillota bacterium]